jgi:hypothetical protein
LTTQGVYFVTPLKENADYGVLDEPTARIIRNPISLNTRNTRFQIADQSNAITYGKTGAPRRASAQRCQSQKNLRQHRQNKTSAGFFFNTLQNRLCWFWWEYCAFNERNSLVLSAMLLSTPRIYPRGCGARLHWQALSPICACTVLVPAKSREGRSTPSVSAISGQT